MSEDILDIARRVREREFEAGPDAVALAEAVERMAAWLREIATTWPNYTEEAMVMSRDILRELGIPLEEAGDATSMS